MAKAIMTFGIRHMPGSTRRLTTIQWPRILLEKGIEIFILYFKILHLSLYSKTRCDRKLTVAALNKFLLFFLLSLDRHKYERVFTCLCPQR